MRGVTTQTLRLMSGLVLFAFATTHFLNHAVGLFSLEAMDQVQEWRLAVTRSWPGMVLLGGALLSHAVLALVKTAKRGSLWLQPWEIAQLATGLAIPFLLLPHIIDTHVANALFDVQDSYLYVLARLWPDAAWTQSLLLLLVWGHGCLGLHHWLKFRRWYRFSQPIWVVLAVAVPMAALMGFIVSGRAVAALLSDPAMAERMRDVSHWPGVADIAKLFAVQIVARIGFAVLLAVLVAGIAIRQFGMLAAPKIAVAYSGGATVQTAIGPTLLEISRSNDIVHSSQCGGRARCGLCRVRIDNGADSLGPLNDVERSTLARFNAPDGTRLACQIRPSAPLTVTRLVVSDEDVITAVPVSADDAGVRRPLCLLLVRIRDFDAIARDRQPYDLVFLLNEVFAAAGRAIEDNSGRIDRFLGDGVLAVFGEQRGLDLGCSDALLAARAIDLALDRVNEKLAAEIGRPVQACIGISAGEVVQGRIGFGRTSRLAVVGPGVDLPARLAGVAAQKGCQLAMSVDAARRAGLPNLDELARDSLAVEGDAAIPTGLVEVARVRDLAIEPSTAS